MSFFKLCFFPVVKNMNEREGERTERKGGREVKEKEGIQASEDALAQVLGEEAHPDCSTPTCPGGFSAASYSASVSASESGLHTSKKS